MHKNFEDRRYYNFFIVYLKLEKKENYEMEINFEERYLQGGIKTAAGIGRIVPYNEWLTPFVEQFAKSKSSFRVVKNNYKR